MKMHGIKPKNTDLWNNYLNCAYEFLECTPNDNLTKLRENFFYKIMEAHYEKLTCINNFDFYYCDVSKDHPNYEFLKEDAYHIEMQLIYRDVRLLCDSYLAILLSKIDSVRYGVFIKGFLAFWKYRRSDFFDDEAKYNPFFALRFPNEEETIEIECLGYVNKTEYLARLNQINDYSTNDGFMRQNSSLSLIIGLEEELFHDKQVIKVYEKKKRPCGRILEKDGDNKRRQYIRETHSCFQKKKV